MAAEAGSVADATTVPFVIEQPSAVTLTPMPRIEEVKTSVPAR
jgi:hypothetical protein